MYRVPNVQIRELCRVKKALGENMVWWFGHVEKDKIARVYV